MATLYKTDGSRREVLPQYGRKFTLAELQGFVGGIEPVKVRAGVLIVNQEGKIHALPPNPRAGLARGPIVGDAVLMGRGIYGDGAQGRNEDVRRSAQGESALIVKEVIFLSGLCTRCGVEVALRGGRMCRVCMKEIGRAVPVYAELTEREKQVVDAVARGKSNKVIAHDLGVTVGTIKTYLATIFRKLHFQDRTSLALWRQREQLTRGIDRIAEGIDLPPADNPDGLKTKWAAIKDGTGKVVGYIELFWGGNLGWVSVPGASRVIAPGSEVPS